MGDERLSVSELEVEVVEPDPAPAVFVGVRGVLSATERFLLIWLMMFSLWSKVISKTKKEKDRWRIFRVECLYRASQLNVVLQIDVLRSATRGAFSGKLGTGLGAPTVHVTQAMEFVNDKFHVGVS